jgi:mannan endo-1,4-beta-mannosidase
LALFDFEGGTEGWAQANWQTGASTATQSAANASHGTHSLAVHSVDDGYWFGASFPVPVDLSTRTVLRYDITSTTGTGASLALQLGPSYTWCQLNASGWFTTPHVGDADTDAGGAIAFDLTSLDASCRSLLNDVRGMFISVNSGSDTSIDYVRAN